MIHPDFDRSAFLDPTTGDFRFPKYASAPGSLVRVRDRTKYSSELWTSAGYTAEEKRHYSIKCFEEEALPEIEVDGFEILFKPKSKKFLGALGFLSGGYQLVKEIGFALDPLGENAPFLGDGPLHKLLIEKKVLIPVHDRSEYLHFFRATDLKPFAKTAGIKVGLKKDELISEIITHDVETNLPLVVKIGPSAKDLLNSLCRVYLDDIETSTSSWHPLVRYYVWDTVAVEAEIEAVESAAEGRKRLLGIRP